MDGATYEFDRFRLEVAERRLWKDEKLVPLRGKAFDTLVMLVEGANQLQTQEALIERLWPDVAVEPNNLQHNISLLRKALEDSNVRVETVPRNGYRLLADVKRAPTASPTSPFEERLQHQTIRFCRTPDDVGLAWAELGEGPPIVRAGNWCSHLELEHSTGIWSHILESLSAEHRLIRYDARGNGHSDHEVSDVSFEPWVTDLETVVAAAGLKRFPLVGFSQGAAVATAFAARHPEQVSALVLVCGLVRGWRVKRLPNVTRHFEALLALMETGWGQDTPAFRQIFSTTFFPGASKETLDAFNQLQRGAATPRNAARILSGIGDIDLRSEVARVRAPTLVIHARNDLIIPFSDGKELAAGIVGSRFVPIETQSHVPLRDDPAWGRMEFEIRSFLAAHT